MVIGFPVLLMYRNSRHWNPDPVWIAAERRYEGGWSAARSLFYGLALPVGYMGGFFGGFALAGVFGRKKRLAREHWAKMVALPTRGSAFWKKPEIQAVLLPASSVTRVGSREPRVAAEFEQAVRDLAKQLPPAQRMIGAEASAAARQAVDALSALELQITAIERDVDLPELARLEQRLAASANVATPDAGDAQAMRALLTSQLELLRRMQTRLEDARSRRDRIHEGLRTLWLQVADLRALAAQNNTSATDVTGRLRALCEEMQRQTNAADSVAALVAPARTPGASIPG
jgi:hypothetical protein